MKDESDEKKYEIHIDVFQEGMAVSITYGKSYAKYLGSFDVGDFVLSSLNTFFTKAHLLEGTDIIIPDEN